MDLLDQAPPLIAVRQIACLHCGARHRIAAEYSHGKFPCQRCGEEVAFAVTRAGFSEGEGLAELPAPSLEEAAEGSASAAKSAGSRGSTRIGFALLLVLLSVGLALVLQ